MVRMVAREPSVLEEDPVTFVGGWMTLLRDVINRQGQEILSASGALTPARCVSVFLTIARRGAVTTADLARWHGFSHQLMRTRIAELTDLGLIQAAPSREDARKVTLQLTRRGRADLAAVEAACALGRRALHDVFAEAGFTDPGVLPRIAKALERRPLKERIHDVETAD